MSNVLYPNKQEFDELIKNDKVLVDFFATWCGPCKMIGPNIEKLAEENADATVIKIDVDKHPEIAAVFSFFLFYKSNKSFNASAIVGCVKIWFFRTL